MCPVFKGLNSLKNIVFRTRLPFLEAKSKNWLLKEAILPRINNYNHEKLEILCVTDSTSYVPGGTFLVARIHRTWPRDFWLCFTCNHCDVF